MVDAARKRPPRLPLNQSFNRHSLAASPRHPLGPKCAHDPRTKHASQISRYNAVLKLLAGLIGLAVTVAGCTFWTTSANEPEFSENLSQERRQAGLDAVNQIQIPEQFEIELSQGTPAEAPSLANQNNPLPASFKYHIDAETDVPPAIWFNELKAEIESHGKLEAYGRTDRGTVNCSGFIRSSFRHVDTGDLFLVDYEPNRPFELTFYYRYSAGGVGSFGPVDQLFQRPGPHCVVDE